MVVFNFQLKVKTLTHLCCGCKKYQTAVFLAYLSVTLQNRTPGFSCGPKSEVKVCLFNPELEEGKAKASLFHKCNKQNYAEGVFVT